MAIDKRKLYESNKAGFRLIIFYIILNVAYSIFIIKTMETNYGVGIFIMTTIVILLLGFLTAVKVQNYSIGWSYVALALGVFQFVRPLFTNPTIEGSFAVVLNIMLIVSGILSIAGGVVSIRNTRIRKKCVKEYNRSNNYRIK